MNAVVGSCLSSSVCIRSCVCAREACATDNKVCVFQLPTGSSVLVRERLPAGSLLASCRLQFAGCSFAECVVSKQREVVLQVRSLLRPMVLTILSISCLASLCF